MPPSSGTNRMAQYARNASMDSGLPNGSNNQADQLRSGATGFPTRQTITESARLPAPKPLASGIPLVSHIRQPEPGLAQPQSAPPMHPRQPLPDSSPPPPQRKRSNSQSSDGPGFWPESHIDSQFGSPTTQRTERYDAGIDDRLGALPHSLQPAAEVPAMPEFEDTHQAMGNNGMPSFIIGKDGSMRVMPKNQYALPITHGGMAHSREQQHEHEEYSSEPLYNNHRSPQRQTRIAIHPTTVKRPYGAPAFEDDEEVFSDAPTRKVPHHQQNLRRVVRRDRPPESRRAELFPEEEEVDGSLASDYPATEDDHGTPRASRKKSMPTEVPPLEGPLPIAACGQRDKSRKRRREKCDYGDEELQRMTYSQLREQPFDEDPAKTSLPTATPLNGDSLSVKLEHFKDQRESDQKTFFSQMSVGDWERSGDWFLDQFGSVAKKLKEARKEKRDMVDRFETEIAKREEAVRVRTENITKKLSKIRHKGEDMLADKEV
ncbi:hypothetical protein CABS01_08470 [Colletotrichum abscissum]|uniref:uncharacterized protein n=1 Tax=Colletotrichum abscissum TaxID=1671311 RepID=UPI0027D639E8|nr:uncharacterized protein CABS01_08470 [Colletotrichum abscissum]KAK1507290.1 hypothetical protein CABS01_08470 [Colletotrichum abscissum]